MNQRPIVLIVNDEPVKIRVLERILDAEFEVVSAQDGERGLQVAAEVPTLGLILLDIVMPGLGGYEVCRRLKEDPATRNIPVIFLTAVDDEDDEAYGLGLGAVDYIADPFSPTVLLARVRTHMALSHARRELESLTLELAEKNQSLEWTHHQLKETLESRLQLINAVSHDLRSPLTSILLGVEQIQTLAETLPPRIEKALGIMTREADRLNAIIAGLLDHNRAESLAQRLNLVRGCPREILAKLEDTLAMKAEDRGLRSHLYLEPGSLSATLMLDVAAMQQVLFNLVENALKFTPSPGDVGVRSTLQGPAWLLEVWDSGRGIPKAECDRMFQSFQQSQDQDAQKGWGLGLFICRAIVTGHGGRIEVDSDTGKGAIFRIFLPLAQG